MGNKSLGTKPSPKIIEMTKIRFSCCVTKVSHEMLRLESLTEIYVNAKNQFTSGFLVGAANSAVYQIEEHLCLQNKKSSSLPLEIFATSE